MVAGASYKIESSQFYFIPVFSSCLNKISHVSTMMDFTQNSYALIKILFIDANLLSRR